MTPTINKPTQNTTFPGQSNNLEPNNNSEPSKKQEAEALVRKLSKKYFYGLDDPSKRQEYCFKDNFGKNEFRPWKDYDPSDEFNAYLLKTHNPKNGSSTQKRNVIC